MTTLPPPAGVWIRAEHLHPGVYVLGDGSVRQVHTTTLDPAEQAVSVTYTDDPGYTEWLPAEQPITVAFSTVGWAVPVGRVESVTFTSGGLSVSGTLFGGGWATSGRALSWRSNPLRTLRNRTILLKRDLQYRLCRALGCGCDECW